MDFREKILKEGTLKHRQTSYALPRWKTRYLVFKISGGGRLQFIIYKDTPTSPVNEVKEIPIEEFGGLESTAKVDSEKHVFSVITTNMTDSFSTESAEDLKEWVTLLEEYLGKELTFGVVIPQKQGQLKSGRGVLRIRNTGFTITTADSPPRCMGTWQITHIRKFGGTASFKFQTGSKCPSGEMLYTLQTDNNSKVKSLFNDLSQHKPIFCDDRVGRRMTLERNYTHHGPQRQSPSRFSLQSSSGKEREGRDSSSSLTAPMYENKDVMTGLPAPTYENKDIITGAVQKLSKQSDGGTPPALPPSRHHSANDDRTPSVSQQRNHGNNGGVPSPLSPAVVTSLAVTGGKSDDHQRIYQNIGCSGHTSCPGSAPHSPTKLHRSGGPTPTRYPVPPVPDGYYNVSPPLALKKYPSNTSSPLRLSPEDDNIFSEFAPVPPPPIKTVSSTTSSAAVDTYSDPYFRFNSQQRPVMKIEGENLVVQRTSNGHHSGGPGYEGEGGRGRGDMGNEVGITYQNLNFMNRRPEDTITNSNIYIEDTDSGGLTSAPTPTTAATPTVTSTLVHHHHLPIIHDLDSNNEIHNYTNVDFALESAQGSRGFASNSSKQFARTGDVRRKVSAPPLSRDRSGAMSYKDPSSPITSPPTNATTITTITTTNNNIPSTTTNLAASLHPKLKPSLSNQDLKQVSTTGKTAGANKMDLIPEYYNLFVPRLPAHQNTGSLDSRTHNTLSSFQNTPLTSQTHAVVPVAMRQYSEVSSTWREGVSEGVESSSRLQPGAQGLNEVIEQSEDEEDDEKVPSQVNLTNDVIGMQSTSTAPRYDHLELVRTNSGTTRFSPSPSPENLSRSNTPHPSAVYDQLALKEPSSSPSHNTSEKKDDKQPQSHSDVVTSTPYTRKVGIIGHGHTYDYIEVMLRGREQENSSAVPGPEISKSSRHNSDPGKSDSDTTNSTVQNADVNEFPSQWIDHSRYSLRDQEVRSPSTQSRRKPLPLQSVPLDDSFNDKITDQKFDKPLPKPRKTESISSTGGGSEYDLNKPPLQSSVSRERSHSPVVVKPTSKHIQQKNIDSLNDECTMTTPPLTSHQPSSLADTKPILSKLVNTYYGSQSLPPPAVPSRQIQQQTSFTVSLPATEFQFNKPLVPPKPRVLENKPSGPSGGTQYAQMRFSNSDDELNYTKVSLNHRINTVVSQSGGNHDNQSYHDDKTKVVYQSINFEVTEGLRKTREDVENQRSREIEWLELQRREQNMIKPLTAAAK